MQEGKQIIVEFLVDKNEVYWWPATVLRVQGCKALIRYDAYPPRFPRPFMIKHEFTAKGVSCNGFWLRWLRLGKEKQRIVDDIAEFSDYDTDVEYDVEEKRMPVFLNRNKRRVRKEEERKEEEYVTEEDDDEEPDTYIDIGHRDKTLTIRLYCPLCPRDSLPHELNQVSSPRYCTAHRSGSGYEEFTSYLLLES